MSLTEFFSKIVVKDTQAVKVPERIPEPSLVEQSGKPSVATLASLAKGNVSSTLTLDKVVVPKKEAAKETSVSSAPLSIPTPTLSVEPKTSEVPKVPETKPEPVAVDSTTEVPTFQEVNMSTATETPKVETKVEITPDPAHTLEESYPEEFHPEVVNTVKKIEENIKAVEEGNVVPEAKQKPEELSQEKREMSEKLFGRDFVTSFLSEFNDLLVAGKELETKINEKNSASLKNELEIKAASESQAKRTEIARALSNLFTETDDKKLGEYLGQAVEAYEKYASASEAMVTALNSKATKENNSFLMLINAKKSQIKTLTEKLGGTQIIENMKTVIRGCEKVAKDYATEVVKRNEAKEKTVEDVMNKVKEFTVQDPKGLELLLQKGDILDVMIHIYGNNNKK
jgi:hypothetical protein